MDTLRKLGEDYGLTPEGVRHAIETYQDIICEITGGRLSKLTYDADYILEEAEEYYRRKFSEPTISWDKMMHPDIEAMLKREAFLSDNNGKMLQEMIDQIHLAEEILDKDED